MTKLTYAQALEVAINAVDGEVAEKLKALKASIEKKNASKGDRKPTKNQEENEVIKTAILEVLADGKQKTVTDIIKNLDGDYTNQKISALMRQLIAESKVEKITEKRKSYFKIA